MRREESMQRCVILSRYVIHRGRWRLKENRSRTTCCYSCRWCCLLRGSFFLRRFDRWYVFWESYSCTATAAGRHGGFISALVRIVVVWGKWEVSIGNILLTGVAFLRLCFIVSSFLIQKIIKKEILCIGKIKALLEGSLLVLRWLLLSF